MSRQTTAPSISVIIPLFNKARHVRTALESVLAQTVPPAEIIVVDDASTDGGADIVRSVGDDRIRVLTRDEPGPGGYAARNVAIENANGEWIAFLDADDYWREDHLERISVAIESAVRPEVVFTNYSVRKGGDRAIVKNEQVDGRPVVAPLRRGEALAWFAGSDFMHTSGTAVRTEVLRDLGAFPAGEALRGGDSDLWLRLILADKRIAYLSEPTSVFVQEHSEIITSASNLQLPHIVGARRRRYGKLCRDRSERELLARLANRKTLSRISQGIDGGAARLLDFRHLVWWKLSRNQLKRAIRLLRRTLRA